MAQTCNKIKLAPDLPAAVIGEKTIKLSPAEFRVLAVLVRHKGKPVTRPELLTVLKDGKDYSFTNIIDVYINYLRGKIGKERIRTVRGVGYAFQEVEA